MADRPVAPVRAHTPPVRAHTPPVRVYAVEDQWASLLERGGPVDFYGSALDVPAERKFADVASIQRYVDSVLSLDSIASQFPAATAVVVRARKGQTRAHYEPEPVPTIAVPLQERWAGRESVILHELAHHLACSAEPPRQDDPEKWHGARYRSTMCTLVQIVLGDAACLLLRTGYEEAGLSTVLAS